MIAPQRAGSTHRWPALERVLLAAGMECVRTTADYEAWSAGDDAEVRVFVYGDGHWSAWDEHVNEEIATGRSSVHLGVALAHLREGGTS